MSDTSEQQMPFYKRPGFWVAIASLLPSITSLGENLFRGLLIINYIIDAWHALFAPMIDWLNKTVFQYFDFDITQIEIDILVILGVFWRMLLPRVPEFYHALRNYVSSQEFELWKIWVWLIVFLATGIVALVIAFAFLYGKIDVGFKVSYLLIIPIIALILRIVDVLSKSPVVHNMILLSYRAFWAMMTVYALFFILVLNYHADSNLPYIERWLKAWDDAVTEKIEGSYNNH